MTKRQAQGLNRLSVAAIKYLESPGWRADGGGLYLEINANGRKRWAVRLIVNGKRRDFGLGPLHKATALCARVAAVAATIDLIAIKTMRCRRANIFGPLGDRGRNQLHLPRGSFHRFGTSSQIDGCNAGVLEGLAQAQGGEFASDEDADRALRRPWA